MSAQTGSDSEFNETLVTDLDYVYDENEENDEDKENLFFDTSANKKSKNNTVRRRIEHRLEQIRLKEQIDSWGFDDQPDIDLEH